MQALFLRGEVYGTTHLYSGQEAVAVGLRERARDGDRVACTYRGHGHAMALGLAPEALLAEMLGRSTGVNGGRAGSMNIVDREHGLIGCYGIVGGSIAAATGAALAFKGSGSVAVAYFGDGATNQAYFFECLNFAKVLNLPLVFVCENNGYGEYTPMEDVTGGGSIIDRAETMGMPATGSTGWTCGRSAGRALEVTERVRAGEGPTFVEARTYRFVGHSRSDPGKYRPEGELERWQARDPLVVARERLHASVGARSELQEVAAGVERELDRVEAAALPAPFPEPEASRSSSERSADPRCDEHRGRRRARPRRKRAGGGRKTPRRPARRQPARAARAARPQPARARTAARGVAEPGLPDRDRQDPAVGADALRDRQRARRLAGRDVRAGGPELRHADDSAAARPGPRGRARRAGARRAVSSARRPARASSWSPACAGSG